MGGGSWKVAYADFVTAMMAFFLLMWLLSQASEKTLSGLAGYFTPDAQYSSNVTSPVSVGNNPLVQSVDKLDTRQFALDETQRSNYAIAEALQKFMLADALPSASSGITSDGIGVLLHLTPDLMFEPGTVNFTKEGQKALEEVVKVMGKYKVYLVVRGHADHSENPAPYPSLWELSAARANSAVRYLVEHGVDPMLVRSVSYADTRPKVPAGTADAARQNGRVEFQFHRPEVMSNVVGY